MTKKLLYDQKGKKFDDDMGPLSIIISYLIGGFIFLIIGGLFSSTVQFIVLFFLVIGTIPMIKDLARSNWVRFFTSIPLALMTNMFTYIVLVISYYPDNYAFFIAGRVGWVMFFILSISAFIYAPKGNLTPYKQMPIKTSSKPPYTSHREQIVSSGMQNSYQVTSDKSYYSTPISKSEPAIVNYTFCSNCGEQNSGNFCAVCGMSLKSESPAK